MKRTYSRIGWLVAALLAFSGCGGDPADSMDAGGTGKLYVTSPDGSEILRFDFATTANGNITPSAVIRGPQSTIQGPRFIHLDVANDRLYLANNGGNTILVFYHISTRNGDEKPDQTIGSAHLQEPVDVSLDPVRNELYVSNHDPVDGTYNILVFPASANGVVVPTRKLTSNPAFDFPHGLLYDSARDRLYVADLNHHDVKVFDGASGLTYEAAGLAPTRTITIRDDAGALAQPISVRVDSANHLVVGTRLGNCTNVYADADTIQDGFDKNPPVARRIGKNIAAPNTTYDKPHQIFLVPDSDEIYVANAFAGSVVVFANYASANGDLTPTRALLGPDTGLEITPNGTGLGVMGSAGIAMDPTR